MDFASITFDTNIKVNMTGNILITQHSDAFLQPLLKWKSSKC